MIFQSIRWRIAFPYVLLILLSMVGLTVYLSTWFQRDYVQDIQGQLKASGYFAGQTIETLLSQGGQLQDLNDALANRWADALKVRVTIVMTDGRVLADSEQDSETMENHLSRPEIQQALTRGAGTATRFSQTMGYDMLYNAVSFHGGIPPFHPPYEGGQREVGRVSIPDAGKEEIVGVVRLAIPVSTIDASVVNLRYTVVVGSLVAAILAIILAFLIAGRTTHPVRQLTRVVERMAQGDLSARLMPVTRDEIGRLTVMFNRMAEELQEKITTMSSQRKRLAAILEHMADGMIITDEEGRVQMINRTAARLLGTTQNVAVGSSFVQVARDHELVQAWQQCNQWDEEQVDMVELDRRSLFVRIIVTPIHEGDIRTCLVILQDLTQVQRLESVRRDFISNISHELRTPLASLKALVDTLRDGALDDPPAAQHFLDRMETEVDALVQIVDELLELSRLESGRMPFQMRPAAASDLIGYPVERLSSQAERAGLRLKVDVSEDLPRAMADVERIQRVISNLIHNAIKFTPAGGTVRVSAKFDAGEDEVVIAVEDTGVGIPEDDLSRIFERFYKADRARQRGSGTGLGLAIARHIVQAHDGRIWVDSVEKQGSTFYFSLPVAKS